MKRTTLMVDEALLEEAARLSHARTYSDAVDKALRELVRRIKAGGVLELRGSGGWEGTLPDMRRDVTRRPRR